MRSKVLKISILFLGLLRDEGWTEVVDPVLKSHIENATDAKESERSDTTCVSEFTTLCAIPIDVNWGRDEKAEIERKQVKDLSGLEEYDQLRAINLSSNRISNIEPACQLPHLEYAVFLGNQIDRIPPFRSAKIRYLSFAGNQLQEIDSIISLQELEYLELRGNRIKTLPSDFRLPNLLHLDLGNNSLIGTVRIEGFSKLGFLDVFRNEIESIELEGSFTSLESLDISWNNIEDLSPISGAKSLRSLSFVGNQVEDIHPLSEIRSLQVLVAHRNRIEDISVLAKLPHLKEVNLMENPVTDLSPLVENEGIGDGDTVILSEPSSHDEEFRSQVKILESRGVEVRVHQSKN